MFNAIITYLGHYFETRLQIKLDGGYGTATRDLHYTKITTLQHFYLEHYLPKVCIYDKLSPTGYLAAMMITGSHVF